MNGKEKSFQATLRTQINKMLSIEESFSSFVQKYNFMQCSHTAGQLREYSPNIPKKKIEKRKTKRGYLTRNRPCCQPSFLLKSRDTKSTNWRACKSPQGKRRMASSRSHDITWSRASPGWLCCGKTPSPIANGFVRIQPRQHELWRNAAGQRADFFGMIIHDGNAIIRKTKKKNIVQKAKNFQHIR